MIPRPCICIPTYNNPKTVADVISECLRETSLPVLVIDDGSTVPVAAPADLPESFKARLSIVRFDTNRGKGAALQEAIRRSVAQGYTHMVSIDADGQHHPQDIARLLECAQRYPWDLVIGSRRFESENVPNASRFGRKFSNFWVKFETSVKISDSQSGFRVYPLFRLQNARFFTRRFDFEIEVLIRLLWQGATAREVEVDVHYPKPGERISHFDKFWDNVRISLLNTALVTLSLLKDHRKPKPSALAVGLGIAIGTTPFFGFHALIAAVAAVGLRLNGLLLLLGTQISIPPLAPFLAMGSIWIGSQLLGLPPDTPLQFSGAWLLGSLILGPALGATLGLLWYGIARTFETSPYHWTGKPRGGKFGNWFLAALTRRFGRRPAYFCLYFIVPYFYLFAPKARRAGNEYWKVLSERDGIARNWFQRQLSILKQFLVFAKIQIDRVHQSVASTHGLQIKSKGIENILEPLAMNRGLLLVGAHVGGWELAAGLLGKKELPDQMVIVRYRAEGVPEIPQERLQTLAVNRMEQPILKIRELLSQGFPVALMGDRPITQHFELVPFLGKLAPLDLTPFRVAALCNTPLVFTFGFKGQHNDYEMIATRPISLEYRPGSSPSSSKDVQHIEWAATYAAELERQLLQYPEQWFNFFPFFSAIPSSGMPQSPQH